MASSVPISTTPQTPLLCSSSSSFTFPSRRNAPTHLPYFSPSPPPKPNTLSPSAKFQLSELMGGRGLCGGEQGLQNEINRPLGESPTPPIGQLQQVESPSSSPSSSLDIGGGSGAFEKELLGLTGGFPGGEQGLQRFIEQNPPPENKSKSGGKEELGILILGSRPKPPELPLFMPGMIVIVKNPGNPYYMYTGIVQRVTDGMAGVLFEGGNWDKLLTFRIDELEGRDKGPPMVNPKSAVLETLVDKSP